MFPPGRSLTPIIEIFQPLKRSVAEVAISPIAVVLETVL